MLLDTHALLWFAADDRRLSRKAAATLEGDDAETCISAASIWDPHDLVTARVPKLAITHSEA